MQRLLSVLVSGVLVLSAGGAAIAATEPASQPAAAPPVTELAGTVVSVDAVCPAPPAEPVTPSSGSGAIAPIDPNGAAPAPSDPAAPVPAPTDPAAPVPAPTDPAAPVPAPVPCGGQKPVGYTVVVQDNAGQAHSVTLASDAQVQADHHLSIGAAELVAGTRLELKLADGQPVAVRAELPEMEAKGVILSVVPPADGSPGSVTIRTKDGRELTLALPSGIDPVQIRVGSAVEASGLGSIVTKLHVEGGLEFRGGEQEHQQAKEQEQERHSVQAVEPQQRRHESRQQEGRQNRRQESHQEQED